MATALTLIHTAILAAVFLAGGSSIILATLLVQAITSVVAVRIMQ